MVDNQRIYFEIIVFIMNAVTLYKYFTKLLENFNAVLCKMIRILLKCVINLVENYLIVNNKYPYYIMNQYYATHLVHFDIPSYLVGLYSGGSI